MSDRTRDLERGYSLKQNSVEDLGQLPNGAHLYRWANHDGGYMYASDENHCSSVLWDTCSIGSSTLLAAIVAEEQRRIQELSQKQPTDRNMEIERAAATGGSFLCPIPEKEVR